MANRQNYHLQLPPPFNSIIVGGAKSLLVKNPELFINNDEEDKQMPGVPEFYSAWPAKDIVGWTGGKEAPFELDTNAGGVWTGGTPVLLAYLPTQLLINSLRLQC
jgi:hypothetical protein